MRNYGILIVTCGVRGCWSYPHPAAAILLAVPHCTAARKSQYSNVSWGKASEAAAPDGRFFRGYPASLPYRDEGGVVPGDSRVSWPRRMALPCHADWFTSLTVEEATGFASICGQSSTL